MEYKNYKVEDFLADEAFKKWILNPTPHSNKYWHSISLNDQDLQSKMKLARQIILQLDFSHDDPSEEEISKSLKKVLHKSSKISKQGISNTTIRRILYISTVAAAIIIAIINLPSFFNDFEIESSNTQLAQKVVKENPKGQMSQTYLPDGTKVWLHANSKLIYHLPFIDSIRLVTVYGEAYFEVTKDKNHPFVVESDHLKVIALGTSFNVRARNSDERVALIEGKVSVSSKNLDANGVILVPGEMGKYNNENYGVNKSQFSSSEIAWINGVLVLNDASFQEMVEKLSLWYGVEFQILGEVPNKTVSGNFKNQPLENILQTIGFTFDFEFQIENKNVMLNLK